MDHPIRSYISSCVPLRSEEWRRISEAMTLLAVPANTVLLSEGEVCRSIYFLESGLVRFFHYVDGIDTTKFFTPSVQLFTSPDSYGQQRPSEEYIESLTECRIWEIPHSEVQQLYQDVPNWWPFIRKVLLQVGASSMELLEASKTQTAEARYARMLVEEPELVQQVSIKHLASFLGIAPESLSRIRRKMRTRESFLT